MTSRVVASRTARPVSLADWSKMQSRANQAFGKPPIQSRIPVAVRPAVVARKPVAVRPAVVARKPVAVRPAVVARKPVAKKIVRITQAIKNQPMVIRDGKRIFVSKPAEKKVSSTASASSFAPSSASSFAPSSTSSFAPSSTSSLTSTEMDFTQAQPAETERKPINKKILIGLGVGAIALFFLARKK